MKKITEIIDKNSTGRKTLSLFILTNIVYAAMLNITIPKTMTFSNGMKLLDMMPTGYNSDYIHSLLETLGEPGRQAYLYTQLPVDMIYPALFGISYSLIIGFFLKKINKFNSIFFAFTLLPLIAGIADYFENFGIISLINSYPNLSETSINLTNYFSIIKSITTTISFVALIVILLVLGIQTIQKKRS